MSTIDKVTIQLLRSSEVVHDSSSEISKDFDGLRHPKIPNTSELEYGEVALNVAKDYEIIGIKNSDGEFVYLPFNIAKRMLYAEGNIDSLSEFVITKVNELSAATISLYDSLDEFKTEIRQELSQAENRLNIKINQLSGNTYNAIQQLSSSTYNSIQQLSGNTYNAINNLKVYVDGQDESIRGDLNDGITALNEKINSLSGFMGGDVSALYDYIDIRDAALLNKIVILSGETHQLSSNTFSEINELDDKIDSTSGNLKTYIDEKTLQLGDDISYVENVATTLSGITNSGFTYIQNEMVNTSGHVINYVDEKTSALSSYTTNVSGDLYTYITQQDNQIINQINNFQLSGLSNVELVENGQYYEPLDKEEHYETCYIQAHLGDSVATFYGEWGQDLNDLVWDFVDYKMGENTPEEYRPDTTIPATAETENSQLVTITYVSQNGQTISMHIEPSEYVCREFNVLFSTYGNVARSMSQLDSNKISLADAYNQEMRYVYIEDCPDDIDVYFYSTPTSTPNKCATFEGFTNVWQFNGTLTENSAIALYCPTFPDSLVKIDVKICGNAYAEVTQRGTIRLCYGSLDGGIESTLTNENPVRVFEVLAKSGDVWTNQIIGVASKTQYGIVKIGDNINVNDGVISIEVDQEPISGSTNPIAGGVIYDALMSIDTLTNEEMDILLGGPLPVYLMDDNGEMILDQDGNLIELI